MPHYVPRSKRTPPYILTRNARFQYSPESRVDLSSFLSQVQKAGTKISTHKCMLKNWLSLGFDNGGD